MGETTVVEVERKERGGKAISVTLEALGICFRGYRKRGGGIDFTRFKLGTQVCDKNELWVPGGVYAEIYRRAAAILYPSGMTDVTDPERPVTNPENPKSRQKKRSKTFRRPVSNHTLPLPF